MDINLTTSGEILFRLKSSRSYLSGLSIKTSLSLGRYSPCTGKRKSRNKTAILTSEMQSPTFIYEVRLSLRIQWKGINTSVQCLAVFM